MEDRNTIIGKPGPFEIIESLEPGEADLPGTAPRRRYDCTNYSVCLELAAALNWNSYTCRGCNQQISQPLLWRAHQAKRKDMVAGSLCEHLPEIGMLKNPAPASNPAPGNLVDESPLVADAIDLKA